MVVKARVVWGHLSARVTVLLDSEQSEGGNCVNRGKRSETGSSKGCKGKLGNCLSCLLPEMDSETTVRV